MVVLGCCVRVCCEKATNVTKKVEGRVSIDRLAQITDFNLCLSIPESLIYIEVHIEPKNLEY